MYVRTSVRTHQGCQIFLGKRVKMYQKGENIPNGHKIYRLDGKLTKRLLNTQISSIARPSKIYPSWNFWLENKPSGNPGTHFEMSGPPKSDVWRCKCRPALPGIYAK
jgi:hypothetical protein